MMYPRIRPQANKEYNDRTKRMDMVETPCSEDDMKNKESTKTKGNEWWRYNFFDQFKQQNDH